MTQSPGTPRREPPDDRPAVVAVGEFGERVAGFMADLATPGAPPRGQAPAQPAMAVHVTAAAGPGAVLTKLKAAFAGASGPVVVGLWRPWPALCGTADELAFEYRRPWLPIVMDHPHLRVGPLVVPGRGACFSCFAAWQAQHDDQRTASAAVLHAYDLDGRLGPRGYLCHHARLAAALAHVVLGRLAATPGSVTGQVVSVNVLGPGLRAHRVAARPGCTRCGRPRRRGDSDVLAALAAAITAGRKTMTGTARPGPHGAVRHGG
ncbi:MAG TPA: TOMM precursor leader peptide-binding protein [Streptosporangiaceae bacterium]|jgi:bacteriocin biosynthesis cyclodehydratase domain-containing protein